MAYHVGSCADPDLVRKLFMARASRKSSRSCEEPLSLLLLHPPRFPRPLSYKNRYSMPRLQRTPRTLFKMERSPQRRLRMDYLTERREPGRRRRRKKTRCPWTRMRTMHRWRRTRMTEPCIAYQCPGTVLIICHPQMDIGNDTQGDMRQRTRGLGSHLLSGINELGTPPSQHWRTILIVSRLVVLLRRVRFQNSTGNMQTNGGSDKAQPKDEISLRSQSGIRAEHRKSLMGVAGMDEECWLICDWMMLRKETLVSNPSSI